MKLAKRLHKGTAVFTLATLTLLPLKTLTSPLILGVATTGVAVTAAAPAQAATQQIPASTLAYALNAVLSGSEIRLNSFGTQNGYSWHRANDSYVSLFGLQKRFDLPEITAKVGKLRYSYNVNNITSNNIRLTPQGDAFDLTMVFQTNGSAVKGMCRGPKGLRNCFIGKDKAAPDGIWRNPQVTVRLKPYAQKGGVSFDITNVTIGGDISVGGVCKISQSLCNSIVNYRQIINRQVQGQIRGLINDTAVQDTMINTTRRELSRLGVGPVKSLTMQNNVLTVTY